MAHCARPECGRWRPDLLTQYGVTDYGDGERYRAAVTWGNNFYDDRANVTLALDYFKQELIPVGGDRRYTIFPGATPAAIARSAAALNAAFTSATTSPYRGSFCIVRGVPSMCITQSATPV